MAGASIFGVDGNVTVAGEGLRGLARARVDGFEVEVGGGAESGLAC